MQNYLSPISLNSCLLVGTKSSISNFQTINLKVHDSPKQIKILNPLKKKKNFKTLYPQFDIKVDHSGRSVPWVQLGPSPTSSATQGNKEREIVQMGQRSRESALERERERERGLRIELRCLNCLKFKLNVPECLKLTQISMVFSYFDFFFSFSFFCV